MNKDEIDALIDSKIVENENGEITATALNQILKELNKAIFENKTEEEPAPPVEDVYALSGSFSYSGNVVASGGTKAPTNTLGITKNGDAVSGVTITYSSGQSYATVDSTGKVTFGSHTNTSARTATITATVSCTDENGTHTYTKTATVTQSAYVAPVETANMYFGGAASTSATVDVSAMTLVKTQATNNKTMSVSIGNKLYNIVIFLCPSNMNLQSCVKQGEILDDITDEMKANVTTVTYEGKSMKMYQKKYTTGKLEESTFEIKLA